MIPLILLVNTVVAIGISWNKIIYTRCTDAQNWAFWK